LDRVAGKGETGVRFGEDISGMLNNVRIDIITDEETVIKIATEVEKQYFQHYAGIVYIQDVDVLIVEKFVK